MQASLATLTAYLTLFGVRYPEAPMPDGIIEGPFDFVVNWATGNTAAKDFLTGASDSFVAGSLFSADDKLYTAGFTGNTSRIPGVFLLDGIGLDLTSADALPGELAALMDTWKLVHVIQGANREQVLGVQQFARVRGIGSTDNATERIANDAWRPDFVPFNGGCWKVNSQTDQLQFQLATIAAGSGVTLAGSVRGSGRMRGVFVVESLAQQLGILSSAGGCGPSPDKIADIIGARRQLGQPV